MSGWPYLAMPGGAAGAVVNTAFQIKVDTTKAGSASDTIALPLAGTFDVDWGDTDTETKTNAVVGTATTHKYSTSGTYVIKITGGLTQIYFLNGGDKLKMIEIQNWGAPTWGSLASAFFGCTNMDITATDSPTLSSITSTASMFRNCSALVGNASIANWNVSTIATFSNMFQSCTLFNIDISGWTTTALSTLANTFSGATVFNRNLGGWDIVGATGSFDTALSQTGMSAENYSRTLIGWANQVYANSGPYSINMSNQYGRTYNSTNYGGTPYNNAVDARAYLRLATGSGGAGWTITNDAAA